MTHFDGRASDACILYTHIIFNIIGRVLLGQQLNRSVFDVLNGTVYMMYNNPLFNRNQLNPSGFVVNSFLCALSGIMNNNTFEDTLCFAVNLGGDTDTIAAIAGGIAGAYYGYSSIPKRWIDVLDTNVKKHLDYIADKAVESKLTSPKYVKRTNHERRYR